jgi:hypothetical protein
MTKNTISFPTFSEFHRFFSAGFMKSNPNNYHYNLMYDGTTNQTRYLDNCQFLAGEGFKFHNQKVESVSHEAGFIKVHFTEKLAPEWNYMMINYIIQNGKFISI